MARRTIALGLALATAARRAAACEVGYYQPGDTPGAVPCEICTEARMTWMPVLAIVLSLVFLARLWHMANVTREWWPGSSAEDRDSERGSDLADDGPSEAMSCRMERGAVFFGISIWHLQLVLLLLLLPLGALPPDPSPLVLTLQQHQLILSPRTAGWPTELADLARSLLPVALLDFGRLIPTECLMGSHDPTAQFAVRSLKTMNFH